MVERYGTFSEIIGSKKRDIYGTSRWWWYRQLYCLLKGNFFRKFRSC